METFIAEARKSGRVVIADEAYMDFYGQSCVPLTKIYDNLLVVKTFSKSYSLAGIRCGYAIGNIALVDGLFRMKDCFNSYPVDSLCQAVCTAAIGGRRISEQNGTARHRRAGAGAERTAVSRIYRAEKQRKLFVCREERNGAEKKFTNS